MLNQAAGDRQILAKQLNISPYQLSYVTNSGEGEVLLFYGTTIIPFKDKFDKSLARFGMGYIGHLLLWNVKLLGKDFPVALGLVEHIHKITVL